MPRPLRVLMWTENYWVGGCDRFLADLAHALPSERVSLRLAGNPHPDFDRWLATRAPELLPRLVVPVANLVESPLVRLRREPARPTNQSAGPDLPSAPVRAAIAALRYRHAATNYVRIRRLLRRTRPQVLHLNNGGYPGGESCRVAALAARAEGVPRVVHFVHNMAYEPSSPVAVERAYDARIDRATDVWVTAAHRATEQLRARRRLVSPVRTVHYGLPHLAPVAPSDQARQDAGFRDDALNVVVVANLEPRKGHRNLVEALASLRRRGVRVRTAFVGDGPERADLERLVAAQDLTADVTFLGWREDVPRLLASGDALVLPSLSNECLPYAVLEAMQLALPVVGTDVAGIPEMIEHETTGLVVPPADADALERAIERLAQNRQRARSMGSAGQRRVASEFSVEQMARAMLDVWVG